MIKRICRIVNFTMYLELLPQNIVIFDNLYCTLIMKDTKDFVFT